MTDPSHLTPETGHNGTGHRTAAHPDAGHPDAAHPDAAHPDAGHIDAGHNGAGHPTGPLDAPLRAHPAGPVPPTGWGFAPDLRIAGWLTYIISWLAASASMAVLPQRLGRTVFLALVCSMMAAGLAGIRRYRPDSRRAWQLVAAGGFAVALGFFGRTAYELRTGSPPAMPSLLDLPFAAAYPLFAAGLWALVPRPKRERNGDLLDLTIVTGTLAGLYWVFVVVPMLANPELSRSLLLTGLGYAIGNTVVLAGIVRALIHARLRTPALLLLVAGLVAMLVADSLFLRHLATSDPLPGVVTAVCWSLAYLLIGAAALHPSMAARYDRITAPDQVLTTRRLVAFALLSTLAPAEFGYLGITHRSTLSIVVLALVTGLVTVLGLVRTGQLAGVARRRTERLDEAAAVLGATRREGAALARQLTRRAAYDPLTGLPNRATLLERLETTLSQPGDDGTHALVLVGLDGYSDINDAYGRSVGDELLLDVVSRLRTRVTGGEMLARVDGDQFAMLQEHVGAEQAYAFANQLLVLLRDPYRVNRHEIYVTASIGVRAIGAGTTTPVTAMRDTELALAAAKDRGRDQVVAFQQPLRIARRNQARLAAQLRRALAADEFTLNYQPVVELATGRISSVEALLRWQPTGGRPVPPDDFIPVAEESGQIVPIGDWVINEACATAREWYPRYGLSVAVNVSGRQLTEPDFTDKLFAVMAANDLPGAALSVEITETVLVATTSAEIDLVTGQLARLRKHGIRIAIDDFGTGYSSLSYLRHLPADVLKIDRSFTSVTGTADPAIGYHRTFTRTIVQLGDSLGLTTVAEGIETPEQAEALRAMGCRYGQGFYFARPMSATDLDRMLAAELDRMLGAPRAQVA